MVLRDIKELYTLLDKSIIKYKEILILTHRNPDGDGLAACLALKMIMSEVYSRESVILLEAKAPSFLNFIQVEKHTTHIDNKKYDLVIVIDCHESDRPNVDLRYFREAKEVIFIDHHEANIEELLSNYTYYIDSEEVSTGSILHKLFFSAVKQLDQALQKYYADCIYTTILNDTDNFLNSNVTRETYEISADLMDSGLSPNEVIVSFLLSKPWQYFKFVGGVLSSIESHFEGNVLIMNSDLKTLEELGLDNEATSKIMRWIKGVQGCQCQVYIQEMRLNYYRISFRSDVIDVSIIAKSFNGGGHKKAAGGEISGSYLEVKELILQKLSEVLL